MTTSATAKGIKLKVARLNVNGFDVVRVILALILLVFLHLGFPLKILLLFLNHRI